MKVMDGVLIAIALLIALSFYRAHKDKSFSFNLFDLIMENGRLGRLAFAFMVTLIITSWIMVRLTLDGKMTEGYLMGYGAMWVAGIVAKMFSTQTVSSSSSVTNTTLVTPGSPPAAPQPIQGATP